jgi:hypothetical protein
LKQFFCSGVIKHMANKNLLIVGAGFVLAGAILIGRVSSPVNTSSTIVTRPAHAPDLLATGTSPASFAPSLLATGTAGGNSSAVGLLAVADPTPSRSSATGFLAMADSTPAPQPPPSFAPGLLAIDDQTSGTSEPQNSASTGLLSDAPPQPSFSTSQLGHQ